MGRAVEDGILHQRGTPGKTKQFNNSTTKTTYVVAGASCPAPGLISSELAAPLMRDDSMSEVSGNWFNWDANAGGTATDAKLSSDVDTAAVISPSSTNTTDNIHLAATATAV